MNESGIASLRFWLAAPMGRDVSAAIERLRRAPDVLKVAVMPDIHLSEDVCIGVAAATSSLIYPQAVGGDIGCGMLAVATNAEAAALRDPIVAAQVLQDLAAAVPARRRNRQAAIPPPQDVANFALSHPSLEAVRRREGSLEFATLGSGNHFVELQEDEEGRLWIMVHCGSRAIGPAIRDHHLSQANPVGSRLRALEATSGAGIAYLHDALYARHFADASRKAIAEEIGRVLVKRLGAHICGETLITTDHNHVLRENHGGVDLWVHRKGAMSAKLGEKGVLPGSMGTISFHVEGRGNADALYSSAHGAGRALSRTEARTKVTVTQFERQMEGIWYNSRLAAQLRDEAPSAYKDIRAVLRAQKELVKVVRTLRPVLNYKGV